MKIVQINTTCGTGSTGKICIAVSRLLSERGIENYILYTQGKSDYPLGIKFAGAGYKKIQALKSRILGNGGFNSHLATVKLIRELDRIGPDMVHIHNIHGHDCDLGMLFRYFRERKTKLFWTFHDCWAFTANCPYFSFVGCDQWKTECKDCPQIRKTSWFFDRSSTLYRRKKELFSGLDLTVITPSQWLADLVKESFLKEYPVKVIRNGIDLNVFKPTPSDFRQKHGIGESKCILLGVAFSWGVRKGLDVLVELAQRLDSQKYQIVLVGTDEAVDKQLPKSVISIHRTQNQNELAEIYTAADLFVNPTREEVLGLVNLEAIACGTPVITFRSGGSPECIDETCGVVVESGDVASMEREIIRICETARFSGEDCLNFAKRFEQRTCFNGYISSYCDDVPKG